MRKFDCDINSLGRIFWERDNVDQQSALIQAAPETVSGQVRIWQVYVPAFATPYAHLWVNPDSGGVNIDIADLGGFWVNDLTGNFGFAGGDLFFTGTLTGGSVPAARVDSGTLGVARSWAYTGGDVTSSAGSAVLTIASNAVTYAKIQTQAQATFLMRAAGSGTGVPIAGTATQAKTALAIGSGDVSGLATVATSGSASDLGAGTLPLGRLPALTGGNVTSSAGSGTLTIGAAQVANSMLANMAQATFKMRAAAAGTGAPIDGTAAQAKTALAIANTDVSGLGTMAVQNATAITVGTVASNGGVTATTTSNPYFGEGLGTGFTGDVYASYSSNPTGASYYAYRVYNSLASPIAGWRGDGAVIAVVMVSAPVFTTPVNNKGTVTTAVALDWRQSAYQTIQLSPSTACTMTTTAPPPGPCPVWLKVFAPASGTSLALTYPATFKGGWPTVVTNISRYNFLEGFYDGTNYNYIGGALNIA